MADHLTVAHDDGDHPNDHNAFDGLPDDWPETVLETYTQIEDDLRDADAATLAVLYEACTLLASADAYAEQVRSDGLMIQGYKTQVAHPLIAQERFARTAAIESLRKIANAHGSSGASRAAANLNRKRWHGR
jgi:hypothetical protein